MRFLLLLWLPLALFWTVTQFEIPKTTDRGIETYQPQNNLVPPSDLWVDAVNGNDSNSGLSAAGALRTIQKAANLAGPGTTVHILPGIYRETIRPATSGDSTAPILYVSENGPGTVVIRGSEPASTLNWTQLNSNSIGLPVGVDPANIYYADLSAWKLTETPRFVVQLDSAGQEVVTRLPLAREPDWQVTTEWKHHEFWWAADGGSNVAGCNPATDPDSACDLPWRSATQLTDRTNDTDPTGIEPGNLTTLTNLTGGTLVALDNQSGHYVYRRTITAHDRVAGRITINSPASVESTHRLGWGTKYYVENRPSLLDQPGEWWYDLTTRRLYLWPSLPGNPATQRIEISRQNVGVNLKNRSYLIFDGLTFEFFNKNAIEIGNGGNEKAYGLTVRNSVLRYANRGLVIDQGADGAAQNITNGFTLEDSEVAFMDTQALLLNYWWGQGNSADAFTHAGIVNTIIRRNELHHLGFRSSDDNAVGSLFLYADKLRFENNYVHSVAHNGMQFAYSVIQSPRRSGLSPNEIKTGDILIKDNIFEQACQLTSDCGALKFWGSPPDKHVYRDVLITGNIFRNTFGWTYIAEKRKLWTDGNAPPGQGGFGLYVDMASGFDVYRNIAYNNSFAGFNLYGVWRDGTMLYYNNIAANSLYGFHLAPLTNTSLSHTELKNNIIINNQAYGLVFDDSSNLLAIMDNLIFDYNLYYRNGWNSEVWRPGAMAIFRGALLPNDYYQTLSNIQANTEWEAHGVSGDPRFWDYDLADHDPLDGSWPDFHPTPSSLNLIDQGTTLLPPSLTTLLNRFDVPDYQRGDAFEIGRYEAGFAIRAKPDLGIVDPGAAANYTLCLVPRDLPYPVTLAASSSSPNLTEQLTENVLNSSDCTILTVTNSHNSSDIPPDIWYTLPITGMGGGFEYTDTVRLLIGGTRTYTPAILNAYK